jgi:hypothetical protein
MFIKKFLRPRVFVALLLVMILMVAAYAFAAANNVPVSGAGDGENAISGYDITAVTYTLNGANPGVFDSVGFEIVALNASASTPREIRVRLDPTGSWYTCALNVNGTTVTCNISGASVRTATIFRVVAAQ